MKRQRDIDRKVVQQERNNLEPVLTSPGPASKDGVNAAVTTTPPKQEQQQHYTPPKPEPLDMPRLPEYGRAKYSFHPQGPG